MDCILNQQFWIRNFNYIENSEIDDAMADTIFDIKKNEYCAFLKESQIQDIYKINGFYNETIEGCGPLTFFSLEGTDHYMNFRDAPFLGIIHRDKNFLEKINSDLIIENVSQTDSTILANEIINQFINDKETLYDQLIHYTSDVNTNSTNQEIINYFVGRYEIDILKIDETETIIFHGHNQQQCCDYFFGIKIGDDISIESNSLYHQTVKLGSEYYVLIQTGQPGTGWEIYILYLINENMLEQVFIEGAYST
jgi:hypothetical protein